MSLAVTDQTSDPLFKKATAATLNADLILELAAAAIGAVHITEAFSADQCRDFMADLDWSALSPYAETRYQHPAARLGPVINEFNAGESIGPQYWQAAQSAISYWGDHSGKPDLRSACAALIQSVWDGSVSACTVNGRELFWGIVREINSGTLIHWDEVIREYPVCMLDRFPVVQMAFNAFMSTPEVGGETCVWRKRWHPQDEIHRTGFGYRADAVKDKPHITITPRTGDVVLFDSRNFHVVKQSSQGRRVTISFFIGLAGDGDLVLWS